MKQKKIVTGFFILFAVCNIIFAFQFTADEIAQRGKWERFLKSAKIIKAEDIGEGITKPIRLYLEQGNIQKSGVWKNPEGVQKGSKEGWGYEIAAYKLDQLLGLNMVPPTVERSYRMSKGSLQLWVELEISELERVEQDIPIPEDIFNSWLKIIYLARAFDSLIANVDRTQQNIRYTKDWRLILIDHSRSFRDNRVYTDQLLYGKYGMRNKMGFLKLPRIFVKRLRSLDDERIKKAVGSYLSFSERKAVLKRKKLLLKEIDEMIKEKGEDKVLY